MAEPTIDTATFDALKETTGADFVVELVDTFLDEAPRMLADLRRGLADADADRFRRAAHSLKSNSYTFGAMALGAMARELEVGGLQRAQADAGAVDTLTAEYERVAAALKGLRDA